jgi:hypothetical protein
MRMSGFYRGIAALAITLAVSGALMVTAGTAWSVTLAPRSRPLPLLSMNNDEQLARLVIPAPSPCGDCLWMLFMDEPEVVGGPVVAEVTGRHGSLTIPYPKFCGVIQADALEGPLPWKIIEGHRMRIDTCDPPPPTSSTTTTTRPKKHHTTGSTTTSTAAPVVAAKVSHTGGGGDPSALPFTAATSAATTVATSSPTPSAPQLPFTGVDIKPFVILGAMMMLLGGFLLSTVESRRRMLRRAAAIRLDNVKDGARKTSSWFLGL